MKKTFLHLTLLMLVSVTVSGFCTFTASAADSSRKCVYLVGNTGMWNPPLTAYEDSFTPIYETTPGSNVYQGIAYFYGNQWFRFNSGLEEGDPDNYDTSSWQRHYIGPCSEDDTLPEIGKSNVYFTDEVSNEEVLSPYAAYSSWHMPISGNILLTLDLNENTLTAVSADYPLVCINSTTKPTFSTLENFCGTIDVSQYLSAGKAEIYLYDFAMDTWLSPKDNSNLDANNLKVLNRSRDLVASSTPIALQYSNWQGGIINFSAYDGNIYISAEKDKYDLNHDAKSMYMVTDGTSIVPWYGAPDAAFNRVSELKYVANGTDNSYWEGTVNIPKGAFRVNIISELGNTPQSNSYLVPSGISTDKELNFVNGFAFSSSTETTASNAKIYWSYPSFNGGEVKITVSEKDGKVTFNDTGASLGEIYIIGQDQGWNIDKGDMPLKLTDKGGYYGCYNISAGAYFRFYTKLGDWENNSLGTQVIDDPISMDFSGSEASYNIVNGKGSFCLPSWRGGQLYIYVDTDNYLATFSESPITWAGNIVENSDVGPVDKGLFFSNDNKDKYAMKKIAEGVYSGYFTSMYEQPVDIRIFTGNYGVTPNDPEWYSAYAVSLNGSQTMDLANSEYGEYEIMNTNESIEGTAGDVIKVINDKFGIRQCELVVDLNKKKAYIAPMDYIFLLKEDDPEPHANIIMSYGFEKVPTVGGVMRIGGEFDYVLYLPTSNTTFSWPAQPEVVLDFSNDMLQGSTDPNNGFINKRVKGINRAEGDLVIASNCILDLQHLEKINVYTASEEGNTIFSELERISYVDPIFKGTVKYDDYAAASGMSQSMNLHLATGSVSITDTYEYYYMLYATPEYLFNNYYGGQQGKSNRTIELANGKASAAVTVTNSSKSFELPTLVGAGELEVTLHLGEGLMTIEQKSGNAKDPLTLISSYERFDATPLYPTVKYSHNHTAHFDINEYAPADFYLRTADYQFLIPDGGKDVNLEPDARGYIQLPFEIASGPSARWHFPGSEAGSNLDILVDLDAKVMKIHSSGHNSGFFIHSYTSNSYSEDQIALYNFEERGDNWMREESNGFFTGAAPVKPGEVNYVYFTKALTSYYDHGIFTNFNQDGWDADLTGGKMFETYAWDEYTDYDGNNYYYGYNALNVTTDKPYIKVNYDTKSHRLTITADESSVEGVAADENAATLTIIPGIGNISVMAQCETTISIYNLSGIIVKKVNVPAGMSTIDLSSGFYIAGGKKLLVR